MKLIFHIKSQKYDFVTVSSVPYFWGEEPVHNFTAENQITPTCPRINSRQVSETHWASEGKNKLK